MKTSINRENDELFVISLKNVSGLLCHVNPARIPKPWVMKTVIKSENDECFVVTLIHVPGLTVVAQ